MNHSAMTISRVRPDAADSHFTFLTVGHVQSESVMILLSKTKVVLLALELMNMVKGTKNNAIKTKPKNQRVSIITPRSSVG